MATVSISISNTTTQEQRAAAWALTQINTYRQANGLPAFANTKAYLEWLITQEMIPQWIASESADRESASNVKSLWQNASDTQRANALTALTT